MDKDFYRSFEDRFRGTRELIKMRFAAYKPFLDILLAPTAANSHALDLGCGRGEWLEYLGGLGFVASGVDLDEGMLLDCEQRHLSAVQGDAIEYLKSQPSESRDLISAFHLVEHVSFDQLATLVKEAHRVLRPGGLLIMETPNPENISVATRYFYLDPTHVKPIPFEFLSFVAEYCGFWRNKKLGLQENKFLVGKADITLQEVLYGASPDYAIVCQKSYDDGVQSLQDKGPFDVEYGLSIETLCAQHESRFLAQEQMAHTAMNVAREAQAQARAMAHQLEMVYNSSSWRLTKPLRKIVGFIKSLRHQ